ncbi:hypothetical protein StoSoilB13_41180 (plasmid) [Arthrobacter sp. StoSoilB13]|nr:hypothetical protein StoSoilB13_41180 [Arthrobacter sp. StoSoilB13]
MAGLGSRLQKLGYEVSIAANPAYAHLVVRSGCEYRPLPGDLARIIKRATPGGAKSSGGMLTTWRELSEYMDQAATGTLAAVEAGADVILANSVAPYAYDVAEAVGIPAVGAHLQPVEPSADYPPVLLGSARNLGGLGNRIIGERVLAGPAPYDAPSARLRHELGPAEAVTPSCRATSSQGEQHGPPWDQPHSSTATGGLARWVGHGGVLVAGARAGMESVRGTGGLSVRRATAGVRRVWKQRCAGGRFRS